VHLASRFGAAEEEGFRTKGDNVLASPLPKSRMENDRPSNYARSNSGLLGA
jgi:hypothetical protein